MIPLTSKISLYSLRPLVFQLPTANYPVNESILVVFQTSSSPFSTDNKRKIIIKLSEKLSNDSLRDHVIETWDRVSDGDANRKALATFQSKLTKENLDNTVARLWKSVKAEALHAWNGFKLFGKELGISYKLVLRVAQNGQLTRREQRQLKRSAADAFRIVPISIFFIVPFLEILLPIALRIFPGLLPSTFETSLSREEKLKRTLNARLQMAKFFHEMTTEMADSITKSQTGESQALARDLKIFLEKIRVGEPVKFSSIHRFAPLFEDEITIDNLTRVQLVQVCKYLSLNRFGPDTLLRNQIRRKIRLLRQDDELIMKEGVESLTHRELVSANRDRGLKATSKTSMTSLRRNLRSWLDLSLTKKVPISMLVLSQPFMLSRKKAEVPDTQAIADVIQVLPEELLESVETKADAETDNMSAKLEDLAREQKAIENEQQVSDAIDHVVEKHDELSTKEEKKQPVVTTSSKSEQETTQAKTSKSSDSEALQTIAKAVEAFSTESAVATEAEQLEELKAATTSKCTSVEAVDDSPHVEPVLVAEKESPKVVQIEITTQSETQSTAGTATATPDEIEESDFESETESEKPPISDPSVTRLQSRVQAMIASIEHDLKEADDSIGPRLHLIDLDQDGKFTVQDMQEIAQHVQGLDLSEEDCERLCKRLDEDNDGSWTREDLQNALRDQSINDLDSKLDHQSQSVIEELEKDIELQESKRVPSGDTSDSNDQITVSEKKKTKSKAKSKTKTNSKDPKSKKKAKVLASQVAAGAAGSPPPPKPHTSQQLSSTHPSSSSSQRSFSSYMGTNDSQFPLFTDLNPELSLLNNYHARFQHLSSFEIENTNFIEMMSYRHEELQSAQLKANPEF